MDYYCESHVFLKTLTDSVVIKCSHWLFRKTIINLFMLEPLFFLQCILWSVYLLYIYVAPFLGPSMLSDQTASHLYVASWGFEMRNTLNVLIKSIIFEPQILARNVKSFNRGLLMKSPPALVECICDVTMFIPGFVELIVTWRSL